MFGGMNPSQVQGMMKKMGIAQVELPVKKVIFEMSDGNKLVIDDPNVLKISMQGQVTYQVSGVAHEESGQSFSEEDISIVMDKTGKSKKEVIDSLKENDGDIAQTIMALKD
jgi:nascent polypeptide-associated complex subunit alpha